MLPKQVALIVYISWSVKLWRHRDDATAARRISSPFSDGADKLLYGNASFEHEPNRSFENLRILKRSKIFLKLGLNIFKLT